MSRKVRINEVKVTGYYFPSFPGLVWHSEKFWLNENELKEVYNNGSLAYLIGGTKFGKKKFLQQRRKEAVKCSITITDDLPF